MSFGEDASRSAGTQPPAARGSWEDGTSSPADQHNSFTRARMPHATRPGHMPFTGSTRDRWDKRQAVRSRVQPYLAERDRTRPTPLGATFPPAAPAATHPAPPSTQASGPCSFGIIRGQETEPITVPVSRLLGKTAAGESSTCSCNVHECSCIVNAFTRDLSNILQLSSLRAFVRRHDPPKPPFLNSFDMCRSVFWFPGQTVAHS